MEHLFRKEKPEHPDQRPLPCHVAIIMDGNGRWAREKGLPRIEGHKKGVDATRRIIESADDIGIRVLTLYAFSTENWKRPRKEVFALMSLLSYYMKKERPQLHRKNVRIRTIGDLEKIPFHTRRELTRSVETTSANNGLTLNLAVNYGSRAEIITGIRRIAEDLKQERITPGRISEELFGNYLQTAGLPDPDLLIRTGSEMRISNFLLWQIAYTELWVTPVLWPDFSEKDFSGAISDFRNRHRRFGDIK